MKTALKLLKTTYNAQDDHPDTVLFTTVLGVFEEPHAHKKVAEFMGLYVNPVELYIAWDGNIYPQFKVERVDIPPR